MTSRAWVYITGVFFVAAALSGLSIFVSPRLDEAWLPFAGLTLLAILSQLFKAEAPGRQAYYPHSAFFFAGLLLLPPALFVPLVALPHIVEWTKERLVRGPHLRAWYIQPFNVASHIVSGTTAYFTYMAVGQGPVSSHTAMSVLGVTLAALAYVAVNHTLIGMVLVLARGVSWKKSGVLEVDSLLPDFISAYLGYIIAVLVALNPVLAIPAMSPLVLVHRVFHSLRDKQNNLYDEKTGLWNVRHFYAVFSGEMDRAKRFHRYMTVLVAEVDRIDDLKKEYGQLAVDSVLAGLGQTFRHSIRQYDVAAKLEGNRLALLLPETNPFEALVVSDRLRSAVEEAGYVIETTATPLKVTISIGTACFPGDGVDSTDLLLAAGEASKYAGQRGGNRIVCYTDMPRVPSAADTGSLSLKGDVYVADRDAPAGFANPAFHHPQTR